MAAQTARTKQRAMAVHRLIEASNAVAEKFGVEPPAIPMHHRDPAFLPTLQIEAVVALLERIASPPEPDATADDAPADEKPAKAATKPKAGA